MITDRMKLNKERTYTRLNKSCMLRPKLDYASFKQ